MHLHPNTRIQKWREQWTDGGKIQTSRGSRSQQRSPEHASRPEWVCGWEGPCLLPFVAECALPRYSYDPPRWRANGSSLDFTAHKIGDVGKRTAQQRSVKSWLTF